MRAGGFASVCVALSRTGHDLMATRSVPGWATLAALGGLTAVGYCLADRRRPAWWILLAVEVVQCGLHVWFSSCAPAPAGVPAHLAMTHGAHAHAYAPMPHGGGSLGMLGAHALAGVLVAAWLHAGERALWRALGVIAGLLGGVLRALLSFARGGVTTGRAPVRATYRRDEDDAAPSLAALRHALVRRGPPRLAGAFVQP